VTKLAAYFAIKKDMHNWLVHVNLFIYCSTETVLWKVTFKSNALQI